MLEALGGRPVDLVERVVLVPAVTEGVLLDATTVLVEDGGAELDDVEGVQARDGAGTCRFSGDWKSWRDDEGQVVVAAGQRAVGGLDVNAASAEGDDAASGYDVPL